MMLCAFRNWLIWRTDYTQLKMQSLKDKLKRLFGSNIGFWRPSCGSDLVYNNTIEKGQLVEVAVKAKLANYREKTMEGENHGGKKRPASHL